MQENTDKTIIINSLTLYARLAIVSVSGLLYTRFSLQALGMSDYGLYSVIASIIVFAGIANTIMVTTSNRFIAIAEGRGDREEARRQFNVNLAVHVMIAVATVTLALPLGHAYISGHVNYAGSMDVVMRVYDIAVLSSAVSFLGVPYNGLLIARERFFVFCGTDVLMSLFKLLFSWLLITHFDHKLLVYTYVMAFMTAFPTFVYMVYCRLKFPETVRLTLVGGSKRYLEVFNFSIGIGIGAVATIGKAQGGALIINMFFNTIVNAGLAVASSVSLLLQTFANNVQKPITPQIVKSYASGDMRRCMTLVCFASKATCLTMFFVSIPFLLIPETLLGLWLDQTPPDAVTFMRLIIIDTLIFTANAGVNDYVFATGRIKVYQLIISTLLVASVAVGWLALRGGMPAQTLFYVYIIFSLIVFAVRPFIIRHITGFDVLTLARRSYLPIFLVLTLFLPYALWCRLSSDIAYVTLAYAYYLPLLYFLGLDSNERATLNGAVRTAAARVCARFGRHA